MRVTNLTSPHTGEKIANQFIIEDGNKTYFQSYDNIIAVVETDFDDTIITIDEYYWDNSTTTGEYLSIFLGKNKEKIQNMIDSGAYDLDNLN